MTPAAQNLAAEASGPYCAGAVKYNGDFGPSGNSGIGCDGTFSSVFVGVNPRPARA